MIGMGERFSFKQLEMVKKRVDSERFTATKLFNIIEANNVQFHVLRTNDDGEFVGNISPQLETDIREIGGICIDYRNRIHTIKLVIQTAVIPSTLLAGSIALKLTGIDSAAVPLLAGAGGSFLFTAFIMINRAFNGKDLAPDYDRLIRDKQKLEDRLAGLSLPEEY